MTTASKSGYLNIYKQLYRHPTSCASSADFMAALFFDKNGMHYFPNDPKHFLNDRLVLSKGHAAPLLCNIINNHIRFCMGSRRISRKITIINIKINR